MATPEQPSVPIWAEAKAKKNVDVLKEAAKALEESERVRANQSIATMTERDLAAEQLRLDALLHEEMLTVQDLRRLREIDFYLEGMRQRRRLGPVHEEWTQERFGDE